METTFNVRIWKTRVYKGHAEHDVLRPVDGGGQGVE
jgi:hypothetical protein